VLSHTVEEVLAARDPEPKYFEAGHLAACGYPEQALRLLRRAVEENYITAPRMDNDPLFEKIRGTPEFAAIRTEAIRKQKEVVARRGEGARTAASGGTSAPP
jgi:hypothetical protein